MNDGVIGRGLASLAVLRVDDVESRVTFTVPVQEIVSPATVLAPTLVAQPAHQ